MKNRPRGHSIILKKGIDNMRIFKKVFKIFMILLILLFVGITIFFMTFDLNSYRGMIVTKATEALGRPISIDSLSMKMSLIPTVEVKGIKIDNPTAFNQPKPFVQIDSMDVTLALIPLLSGNIELKDFNLSTANIILIDTAGKNNWTFGGAEQPVVPKPVVKPAVSGGDNILSRLKIDNISVKKLTLSYTKEDKTQNVTLLNASIKQLKLFSMTVLYDDKTVKLSGNLGDLAGFMAKKPNYTFSLNVEAFDTVLKTSGTIGDTANFRNMTVNISATGKNLKNTLAIAGQNSAKIPEVPFNIDGTIKGNLDGDIKVAPFAFMLDDKVKLTLDATASGLQSSLKVLANGTLDLSDKTLAASFGIKPMQMKFDVAATPEMIEIKTIDVAAGKSDVAVKGSVALKGSVPDIVASVSSSYLDADDFMAEKTGTAATMAAAEKPATKGPMFSPNKIDLSGLKAVNAKVTLAAKTIKVPEADYIGLNTALNLRNGILTVSDLIVKTEAGTVGGNITMNASQMPAQIAVKLGTDDLKLDMIKPVTAYVQGSHVASNLNLTTTGDSVQSFVGNLNGQILVELTEGTIVNKGFNSLPVIEELIKNKANPMSFSASDQVSKLVCGVVNLSVKNGVITSKDQIAIETSVVNFAVSGTINLPAEELSLTMVPSVVGLKNEAQRALQLTQIVKISGPFSNLKPSLDAQKTTQAAAQAGLEVLANKLAEKKGIELPVQKQENVGYNLCEKALGRPLKGQTQNRPVPVSAKTQEKTAVPAEPVQEKLPPKEEFKRQLFNSLSEALKK